MMEFLFGVTTGAVLVHFFPSLNVPVKMAVDKIKEWMTN